ncbi:MAG TPA: hypothetical protein PLC54_04835 [Spirochaetales bacterium]|nr:hypothetical protein [Spirochaetales bacterium]
MPHVIHYLDDLYMVDGLARWLYDLSRLEPDADLFGDSPLLVLKALEQSFRRIQDLLGANAHLVDRPEYLRLLTRTASQAAEAIDSLMEDPNQFKTLWAQNAPELSRTRAFWKTQAAELRERLIRAGDEPTGEQDLVSGDELSELLRGGQEPSGHIRP